MNYLLVFLGGGIGSMIRFGVGKVFSKWETEFPFATLVSNLTACLIFTMILYFWTREIKNEWIYPLLSLDYVEVLVPSVHSPLKIFSSIINLTIFF